MLVQKTRGQHVWLSVRSGEIKVLTIQFTLEHIVVLPPLYTNSYY